MSQESIDTVITSNTDFCNQNHCVKSARIRSFSGPYFPVFGLNTRDTEYRWIVLKKWLTTKSR